MKTITCLMIFFFLAGSVNSQVILKGRVTDNDWHFPARCKCFNPGNIRRSLNGYCRVFQFQNI